MPTTVSPALFCWDLWAPGIQQGLGEGKDCSRRQPNEQVPAGDAPLGDGSFHGTDGGGEDVGLLEDLGQLGSV